MREHTRGPKPPSLPSIKEKPKELPVDRGKQIPISKIYPNRFNPNEMDWTQKLRLQQALKDDEYDPITISPVNIFYTSEVLEKLYVETENGAEIWLKSLGPNIYIICDGEQRWCEAKRLGMETIRARVWHMTEKDSMPYFYKRQSLHGEFEPLKEADLFLWERDTNNMKMEDIVRRYNLSSRYYIRDRLKLLHVGPKVLDLFWEPPEGVPGRLTMTHLREIAELPSWKWQKAVALMALHRNWRAKDIEKEVQRIKAGKGIRDVGAYLAPIERAPPERVETPVETRPIQEEPIQVEEPLPDEEIFGEYPDDFIEEEVEPIQEDIETIRRRARERYFGPRVSELPESWAKPNRKIPEIKPPLILNRDLIEPFVEKILIIAVTEGFNLRAENKVVGFSPNELLLKKLNEHLDKYTSRGDISSLPLIAYRAAQLSVRAEKVLS